MTKKLLALGLALCLALSLLAVPVLAEESGEIATSGTCGKTITWVFDRDTGTLTLSGTGNTYNYQLSGIPSKIPPWAELRDQITSIVVEEGITSLRTCVFSYCTKVTSVSLPDSLTAISDEAFYGCSSLESIELPDSITYLGGEVFKNCTSLIHCSLPAGTEGIPGAFFYGCGFTEFTVPDTVDTISSGAFAYCENLTSIDIPDTVTCMQGGVFNGCRALTAVELPPELTYIGQGMFKNTPITEIVIPDKVTRLENEVFAYCTKLTSVTLPDSITSIGEDCFLNCVALTELDLPEELTSIGDCGLRWTGATRFEFPCGLKTMGDYLFEHSPYLEEVVIPCSVTEIGEDIFNDCVKDVVICCWKGTTAHVYAMANGIPYTLMSTPCSGLPFEDVDCDDFYVEAVRWALENGITTGTGATTFSPDKTCSRAEVVTFLWRAAGSPEPASVENPFADVAESDFFYKAVLWAVENGITNGIDATHFGPLNACNRAAVVTFLWRSMGEPVPGTAEHSFTDLVEGQFYYDAVLWAVENGITNGLSASEFGVDTPCNRAQIVTFLHRTDALN